MSDLDRYAALLSLPEPIITGPNLALPIAQERGVCASFFSPDDLDIRARDYAAICVAKQQNEPLWAADFGCSPYLPQAIRFAELGFHVDAFDSEEPNKGFSKVNELLGGLIHYVVTDVTTITTKDLPRKYHVIYANRFLSHLRFESAQTFLHTLSSHCMVEQTRLFLSFSGLDSPLGEGYEHKNIEIRERYAHIRSAQASQNQLAAPMCLYREEDVEQKLIHGLPLHVIDKWMSPSGALKYILGVCKHQD